MAILYKLIGLYIQTAAKIPMGLTKCISRVLSCPLSKVPWSRKRVAINNLRASFGGMGKKEREALYKRILEHFLCLCLETPYLCTLSPEGLKKLYRVRGRENVMRAYERGKGLLLLTAHMGNWELLNLAFAVEFNVGQEFGASVIARPLDNPTLDRWVRRLRTRFGTKVINKQGAMREILRALRQNQAVGILLDQNVDWYQGVFVRFLGRWACTNKAMAQIALKTGAPVIPAFAIKGQDGIYDVTFKAPVELVRSGDQTKDVEETTRIFTDIIQEEILRNPEQWLWFHRRWKTRQYWPVKGRDIRA